LKSPESWFEDFGHGTLAKGRSQVKIDPSFAALVHTDAYHVFLTPEGECNALYVSGKTSAGFEVVESAGGRSNVGFSYRVVAKRKDIAAERLAVIEKPARPVEADLPKQSFPEASAWEPDFSEQRLARLRAGADIPAPQKPKAPHPGSLRVDK
jgi:hypothetical protein